MKFYLATSTARIEDHHTVRDILVEYGHQITYDWTSHGRLADVTEEVMAKVCHNEVDGIAQADFVVVLLPGGKGTHGEVGMAAIAKKRTFIHSDDPARFDPASEAWCGTTFYYHAQATRLVLPTLEAFAHRVLQIAGKEQRKIERPDILNITPAAFGLWWHEEWYGAMEEEDESPLMWEDMGDGAKRVLTTTAERLLGSLR